MTRVKYPFFFVNPKSYYYGEKYLKFAEIVDEISGEYDLQIFFTCPFSDIRMIAKKTKNIIVTAQSMDFLHPGRGMGAILPESLKEAGAGAVVLNHAENQKTVSELCKCILRARELDMLTIACADSIIEAKAIACMNPDIILAEPTDLIGTGIAADNSYTINTVKEVRAVDPNVKIMIASGITTPEDCFNVISLGADGTGSTSGIVSAPDPSLCVKEMAEAILKAAR